MWPRPAFFQDALLNFAENLLFPISRPAEDSIAVIEATEISRHHVSWRELRERVRQCSSAMRSIGIKENDRIAGFVANHCNSLVAMLSASSIGAIWTAISPDQGVHAVLDRLLQIDPKLLFADNAVMYNGKVHGIGNKIMNIIKRMPHLRQCVVFQASFLMDDTRRCSLVYNARLVTFAQFVQNVSTDSPLQFQQLVPDHPLYILFSSGTTGSPKCIVHGAIGTLIQHKKEHDIQCSLRPGDTLFYFTTCMWMMWHWLVSALASGVRIVLYDGSPFRPFGKSGDGDMAMAYLIGELGVTHFGTSAKYLSTLEQRNVQVGQSVDLSKLKAIYSTGSPLAPSTFDYTYRTFGHDINLASITGGTDIISLFGAPSQISPVYAGQIQVRGLGMAVESWDAEGHSVEDEAGDLVCIKPFPSQPVMFWGPEGEKKYHDSYFSNFPNTWHHGDFIQIDTHTGGLTMLGRTDGVLKPAGVRFGSSEIYNVLLRRFVEIEDSLCVGRRREHDSDEMVVLFVKMVSGAQYSPQLEVRIRSAIREDLSARHVPKIIESTPEIPVTINGKK